MESDDWSSFDRATSLRTLRHGTPAQVLREVWKLYLRWWHARRARMEAISKAAGLPQSSVDLVAGVVQTCRECRAWAAAAPDVTPAGAWSWKQDIHAEGDITFYKRHKVWHMLDRSDRSHALAEVASKMTEDLCDAISRCWITDFGTSKYLIVDGEGDPNCSEAAFSSDTAPPRESDHPGSTFAPWNDAVCF